MSRVAKLFSVIICLSLAAGARAEEPASDAKNPAKPPAEAAPEPAAKAEAEKGAEAEKSALPKLPVESEFFEMVFDSNQPEDGWENTAIQQIEMQPSADILVALKGSTPEHLAKHINPNLQYKEMMKTPEKHRGEVVQVRGLLEIYQPFPIPENKSGEVTLWRGQISTIRGYIYTFFSIQKPDQDLIKKPVRLTGVFLKRYAYKNRLEGEKLTWTPAIFVRHVEPFSESDVYQGKSPMSGITALVIAVLVVLLMIRIGFRYTGIKNKATAGNPFTKLKRRRGEGPPGKFPGAAAARRFPKPGSGAPPAAPSPPAPETPPNPDATGS